MYRLSIMRSITDLRTGCSRSRAACFRAAQFRAARFSAAAGRGVAETCGAVLSATGQS